MNVLLVAHGTRDPRGVETSYRFADAVARRLDEPVAVSFVDVVEPSPREMLAALPAGPVTVLPAFLARGHHVRVDVPRHIAAVGRRAALAAALGPSVDLARALTIRLAEAGATRDDAVVLAAAGSSDPHAHADVRRAARLLAARIGAPVSIAVASGSAPCGAVPDVVAELRRRTPSRRVAVASYLLADGLFQGRLEQSGADVVARPIGLADAAIALACARITCARNTPAGRAESPFMARRRPVGSRA